MPAIELSHPDGRIEGIITLSGSKSISNRVLLIRALSGKHFDIFNISDSQDTQILQSLLDADTDFYDTHHAGTTFRFMTAYLALQPGEQVLTGSDRMKQRPIKALVDALNHLGANIEYMENEGFPPLRIKAPASQWKNTVNLTANISSQYISALLLIAPLLDNGLDIILEGEVVSEPYMDMTIDIMKYFGVSVIRKANILSVASQTYQLKDYDVESDWSSASYYYLIAGLSQQADITIRGLHKGSIQGDQVIGEIANKFGITTTFEDKEIHISKKADSTKPDYLEINCIKTPDLAQTIALLCAGNGTQVLFSGLQTLKIKETNRIEALKNELYKLQVTLVKLPDRFSKKAPKEYYLQEGKATFSDETITFDTYDDHRMAMSFAPLSVLHPVIIDNAEVVEKSYPNFWNDLISLGFGVKWL